MRRTLVSAVAAAAVTASLFAAVPAQAAQPDIAGSGSSFANNFIQKCAAQYKAKTGNNVTYLSTGSGTGRKNLTAAKTYAFAASDSVYGATEAQSGHIIVPVIGGAVGIVYKVKGVQTLNLDPKTLGAIFDGSISKWNDPAIKKLNKTAKLPNLAITVVYRGTGSGTTQNVQNYLQETIGGSWPAANQTWVGKQGASVPLSTDMAYKVNNTPGAIGYADLSDLDRKVTMVSLKNAAGQFVKPTVKSASAFLSKQKIKGNGEIDINFTAKAKGGYNLSIVTYLMIPSGNRGVLGAAVKDFAVFAVDTCSKKPATGYAGFTGTNYRQALFFAKAGS
jgi:phosphate transport system substrate-binding protein